MNTIFVSNYFRAIPLVENRGNVSYAHYYHDVKPKTSINRDHSTVVQKTNQASVFFLKYFNCRLKTYSPVYFSSRPEYCTEVTKSFMKYPIAYEFYVHDDLDVTTKKVTIFLLLLYV